jgi:hypothetical protein
MAPGGFAAAGLAEEAGSAADSGRPPEEAAIVAGCRLQANIKGALTRWEPADGGSGAALGLNSTAPGGGASLGLAVELVSDTSTARLLGEPAMTTATVSSAASYSNAAPIIRNSMAMGGASPHAPPAQDQDGGGLGDTQLDREGALGGAPPAQDQAGVALGDARDGEECAIDYDFTTSTTTTTSSSTPSMTTPSTKMMFALAGSRSPGPVACEFKECIAIPCFDDRFTASLPLIRVLQLVTFSTLPCLFFGSPMPTWPAALVPACLHPFFVLDVSTARRACRTA